MTAERWRTISQLYHEALTRSADDRAAFLAERCAGDHELRKEIESLLGDTRDAQRFFDVPANAQLLARLIDRTVPAPSTSSRFIPG